MGALAIEFNDLLSGKQNFFSQKRYYEIKPELDTKLKEIATKQLAMLRAA